MRLYRIYTQHFLSLHSLVSDHFESFTILEGTGYYKGIKENCAIIEIISDWPIMLKIQALVEAIKSYFNQEEVLVIELGVK